MEPHSMADLVILTPTVATSIRVATIEATETSASVYFKTMLVQQLTNNSVYSGRMPIR